MLSRHRGKPLRKLHIVGANVRNYFIFYFFTDFWDCGLGTPKCISLLMTILAIEASIQTLEQGQFYHLLALPTIKLKLQAHFSMLHTCSAFCTQEGVNNPNHSHVSFRAERCVHVFVYNFVVKLSHIELSIEFLNQLQEMFVIVSLPKY